MIFSFVLFVLKLILNFIILTWCFAIGLALFYYWLRIIQGFIEGFNADVDNSIKQKIPDKIVFNEDGGIDEYYDL